MANTFKTTVKRENGKTLVYDVAGDSIAEVMAAARLNWPGLIIEVRGPRAGHEHRFELIDCARPPVCACGEVRQ